MFARRERDHVNIVLFERVLMFDVSLHIQMNV